MQPGNHSRTTSNLLVYFGFLLVALAGIFYGQSISGEYANLRLWDLQNILLLLIGVPFLFLLSRATVPDMLDPAISGKQRWLYPALIGGIFGILDVLVIKVLLHPEPYTELPPFLQPFPYSIFLFFSGALEIEVFYRLIPLTLIFLVGNTVAGGRYFSGFMWAGIVLTALREPLEQLPEGSTWFVVYSFGTGVLMNMIQGWYFKNSGFLANFSLRLGHYLFWHILLGIYVQYVELA